jgi:S-DNA-T family DNA segregation ATPase FtsK/SpoIIIE
MRKEIYGIILFFLVIFTLISILSYSPGDPSINNARAAGQIHNLFGVVGAYVSGLLIGLFGLGAFWIPILLLLASIHFFGNHPGRAMIATLVGGIILVIITGSLLSVKQNYYILLGSKFSAGGIIGIPYKDFLVKYTNTTGSVMILILLWIIGFILATGFSLIAFGKRFWRWINAVRDRLQTINLKRKERKEKAKKRSRIDPEKIAKRVKKIKIKQLAPKPKKTIPPPKQEVFDFMHSGKGYQAPPFNILEDPEAPHASSNNENLRMQSQLLEKKLEDFGVHGKVVEVSPGPVITTFEYAPAAGVKINKIVNLSDDLALALRAISIRIVAPIPGKAAVGIEVPNSSREMVRFKEIVASPVFDKSKSKLTICLGKDIVGNPVVAALEKMPHLLIAGATGTGKSVALNAMICSLLYKATPDEVKLIMVDPKRIELSSYDGIPHLITPVVTDPKKATNALYWAVREMERRYELLSKNNTRNIKQYNNKIAKDKIPGADGEEPQKLPLVVIIIDELADLMMLASRDVEVTLTRLAQMARAAGIHLILATQRPSVDVLTGIIKANFPTRLTFQVSSKTDSRTILDTNGAENLLGSGDMLFLPPGTAKLQRIHGAYISEEELVQITRFLRAQAKPEYDEKVTEAAAPEAGTDEDQEYDERYDDAVALVTKSGQASISMVQRHLRIGYNRAARIIEVMEKEGVVGPSDGVKAREVLVRSYEPKS